MSKVTIGGDRLGSGNRMKADLHGFERSTHDMSYMWKSTMASGTLVPFMSEVGLPGDTFDISLDADVLTHPTIGPLFGSYKVQLDVFQVPMRLYQGKLHMNMLGIGMDMSKVKLPQLRLYGGSILNMKGLDVDNYQVNPSSILAYLGIRGTGYSVLDNTVYFERLFNAVPYLGYWDIYKQYYANKQEEIGVVIHTELTSDLAVTSAELDGVALVEGTPVNWKLTSISELIITVSGTDTIQPSQLFWSVDYEGNGNFITQNIGQNWYAHHIQDQGQTVSFFNPHAAPNETCMVQSVYYSAVVNTDSMQLKTFPLVNIDTMRQTLLGFISDTGYEINKSSESPYGLPFEETANRVTTSIQKTQEGLGIKTYNSDLFNNWISTEWIDGADGISAVTAIDTSDGSFSIDELNLSKKVYNMLNRIALSGGSYDDWLDAVYDNDRRKSAESPIYLGGMMQTLSFQEVISNDSSVRIDGAGNFENGDPLGTLAGRGRLTDSKKGGKIIAKIDEPSYLMGIVSLTPKVDYSQGNKWDVNLGSLDDLHKPSLDQIGFQDLVTDQMAYFDTNKASNGDTIYNSAGKQPAWINYMTNVNVARGNFAIEDSQMFMTLNRKYVYDAGRIKDLTTYIDPVKFNNIFSDTELDAQNFWVQIAVNITARRKMSAKIIPNL